jgi:hypothetical protein
MGAMSILNRVTRLARSRQGRRFASQASRYARSPQGRARIAQVRRQLTGRRRFGR